MAPICCCSEVKSAIKHRHKHCNKIKKTKEVTGRRLNSFYDLDCLHEKKKYVVCSNVFYDLNDHILKRKGRKRKQEYPTNVNRCSKRLKGDKAIPSFLYSVKKVVVKYDVLEETILMKVFQVAPIIIFNHIKKFH